jgi:hypothetical protein
VLARGRRCCGMYAFGVQLEIGAPLRVVFAGACEINSIQRNAVLATIAGAVMELAILDPVISQFVTVAVFQPNHGHGSRGALRKGLYPGRIA